MKNIFKILFLALIVPMFINSCNNDDNFRDWTSPEASFKLYDTTLGSNIFYPTMESNPFTLTWDEVTGTSEYTVEISTTEDFTTPVTLGTSTTNIYTTTIGELNTALLQAGYLPYTSQKVYVRIKSGSTYSSVINFDATTYPTAVPVITAPTSGSSIVLDSANPSSAATTFTWTDYSYGTSVSYVVEIAPTGTTNFKTVGTVADATSLSITNLDLDKIILSLGGVAGVAADYDVRVTANTTSAGGTISSVSEIVTVSITPYQLESYIYAPGGYQGWNVATANTFVSSTSDNIYVGFINFPTAGTEFKLTQDRNWDVNWGDNGADGTLESGGANIVSTAAGYHKITVDLNTNTYTMIAYSIGIVGAYNGWGASADTEMTWDDSQRKFVATLALPVGEFKFRINNSWSENYGDSNDDGVLDSGGDNLSVATAGTYTITYDPFAMTYTIN